ncbi:flagella assembly protein FlgT [Psychrosphaera sp. B3R10]|uniref:flagellar assembly protein T N-terminal domain-containing protein n=1 Tax=unclassified Psychrosphaera TaxID=2641570 RepID=UPI001C09105C|nr:MULTISPECIES: flagellar assembly protein T N-terminal domain-containing protein [unclassified Psychrosphaera]MBU2882041.1 flagella assembly protein FlgT [Psychrosphaera sp. I2R16]MBU2989828.1 flagella assembly protein FlgT [Psychrosphaera sp. B3R10]
MKLFTRLVLLMFTLPFFAHSEWYEATGQAKVRHGDVRSAKNRAVQDALKQAMLFSGANVSSIQKMSHGLLIDDQVSINSVGAVNSVEIVEERQRGSFISVTIRADIFPSDRECYASEFGKKIAITQFPIQHWQDAKVGEIYGLEKEVPRQLMKMFQAGANTIYPIAWFDKKLNINAEFEQQGKVRYQLIDAVAQNANAQFVMFGRISDISFGDKTNSFSFWEDDQFERYFTMELIIANALTHEILYQNRFHTAADWTFDHKMSVNISSTQFWNSEYGHAIKRLLTEIRDDIHSNLNCQKLQSKISGIKDGEQIQINIGAGQGVAIGQEYRVSYRSDTIDDLGNLLTNIVISPYKVRIVKVYENSAIAESTDTDFMSNVQINDIIELQSWDTDW